MVKRRKLKKTIIISSIVVVVISTILYLLAYRYLIERVEVKADTKSDTTLTDSATTEVETGDVIIGDSNYSSDSISISINKVEEGEGVDKVTYFVADVKLKNSNLLKSAFAKGEFGRNIVETTSTIAKENNAIFAINGDYYGFRGDGIEIRNGILYRAEGTRIGAAIYNDGTLKTYDETEISANELISAGVLNTLSFGPALVDDGVAITDFSNVKIDKNFGNTSIQDSNPRTGIGMIEPNHFVFVVVDGRQENYSKGMTLNELAKVFEELGCKTAYNLDGGGSSTMYFNGAVVNNPSVKNGERAISDILYIN